MVREERITYLSSSRSLSYMASTFVRFGGEGLDSSSVLLGRFVVLGKKFSIFFVVPTRSSLLISSKSLKGKFTDSGCTGDLLV